MERPDKRIKSDANSLWHKIIQASEEEAINKCIDIFNRLVQNSAQVGAFLAIRKVATRKQKKEEERKRKNKKKEKKEEGERRRRSRRR